MRVAILLLSLPLAAAVAAISQGPGQACSLPPPVRLEVAPGTAIGHPVLFAVHCQEVSHCPAQDDLDVVVTDASGGEIPGTIDAAVVADGRVLAVWSPAMPLSARETYGLALPDEYQTRTEFQPAAAAPAGPFDGLRWELGTRRVDVGERACCTGDPGGRCELPCVSVGQELHGLVLVEIGSPHPECAYTLTVDDRPGTPELTTHQAVPISGAPERFCATLRATRVLDGHVETTTTCLPPDPTVIYGPVEPSFDDRSMDAYACPRPPSAVDCDAEDGAETCPPLTPGVAAAWCNANAHCADSAEEHCRHYDDYCTEGGGGETEDEDGIYGCRASSGAAVGLAPLLLGLLAGARRARNIRNATRN